MKQKVKMKNENKLEKKQAEQLLLEHKTIQEKMLQCFEKEQVKVLLLEHKTIQ